jgi:hypothetical protein
MAYPSLPCVAGNGGVRNSSDQGHGLLLRPVATGKGGTRTGEHPCMTMSSDQGARSCS